MLGGGRRSREGGRAASSLRSPVSSCPLRPCGAPPPRLAALAGGGKESRRLEAGSRWPVAGLLLPPGATGGSDVGGSPAKPGGGPGGLESPVSGLQLPPPPLIASGERPPLAEAFGLGAPSRQSRVASPESPVTCGGRPRIAFGLDVSSLRSPVSDLRSPVSRLPPPPLMSSSRAEGNNPWVRRLVAGG